MREKREGKAGERIGRIGVNGWQQTRYGWAAPQPPPPGRWAARFLKTNRKGASYACFRCQAANNEFYAKQDRPRLSG
jgi:hypothetical protein